MSKRTMYDVGIQAIFYYFYPILCVIYITFGSISKLSIDYYVVYTEVNLLVVPSILISAGCICFCCLIILLYFLEEKYIYFLCRLVFTLFLLLQIIALIYGCVQAADHRSYLKKAIQRDMGNMFLEFNSNKDVESQFNILQNDLECCGVYSHRDYMSEEKLPVSCCPVEHLYKYCENATHSYDVGCASKVYDEVTFHIGILSYVTMGFVLIQIFGGVLVGLLSFKQ